MAPKISVTRLSFMKEKNSILRVSPKEIMMVTSVPTPDKTLDVTVHLSFFTRTPADGGEAGDVDEPGWLR